MFPELQQKNEYWTFRISFMFLKMNYLVKSIYGNKTFLCMGIIVEKMMLLITVTFKKLYLSLIVILLPLQWMMLEKNWII